MVSGSLSLPSRGSFHLSLTVLVRYRSLDRIQPYEMVLAHSYQIPRARYYSGYLLMIHYCFIYKTFTLFRVAFQLSSITITYFILLQYLTPIVLLPQVWALTRSLTTTQVIVCLLSFPLGTKMFQFPRFPLIHYVFMY